MTNFIKFCKLALKNIKRHPLKNFLVGLIIFLASIMFFFTGSLHQNAEVNWAAYFSSTMLGDYHVTTSKGLDRDYTLPSFTLPRKYVSDEIIKYLDDNNIFYSKRIKVGSAIYNYKKAEFEGVLATLIGMNIEKEFSKFHNIKIIEGNYDKSIQNGVLVWRNLANTMKWKVGDTITLYVKDMERDTYPYNFKITGIIGHKKGQSFDGKAIVEIFPLIMGSYSHIASLLGITKNKATEIAIWDNNEGHQKQIEKLSNKHDNQFFKNYSGYSMIWGLVEMLDFIGGFLGFFILAILIISALKLNLMGFFERRKEIGAAIAMGARPRWVMGLLIMEMIIFATISFIISVIFYVIITSFGSGGMDAGEMSAFFAGEKLKITLYWPSVFTTYFTIIIIMLISSLYPMYLTSKINPIDVFKEGEI